MAPLCPEEVDVFSVPHSRMKELVYKYLDMLTSTNFSSVHHLTELLENLNKTFTEFIAHEQIENRFIMKKLKNKLRSLSIQNTAVCNCHNDNKLTDMLNLLEDGYKCTKKSESDRINFGIKLRGALEQFTETFLPHMAEEEEVFQPLLMQHFTVEELKQIKATVIQQHFKAEEEKPEKCVQDNKSSKTFQKHVDSKQGKTAAPSVGIKHLPGEVLLKVFSHLDARDLCRCAQVSHHWNQMAMTGSLWTRIFPVSWANGNWGACEGVYDEEGQNLDEKLSNKVQDEDADVDESEDVSEDVLQVQKESRMLTSMCKHLLQHVGASIKHCDLAYSRGINNGLLYKLLSLCPNLKYLDLTQTRISDLGFKGLHKNGGCKKLKHLDLTGCLYITDKTLQRISAAYGQFPCHMTQEDSCITKGSEELTNEKEAMANNAHTYFEKEVEGADNLDTGKRQKDSDEKLRTNGTKGEPDESTTSNGHQDCRVENEKLCCPWRNVCKLKCDRTQCVIVKKEGIVDKCCYKLKGAHIYEPHAGVTSKDMEAPLTERLGCSTSSGYTPCVPCADNRTVSPGHPNCSHGNSQEISKVGKSLKNGPLVNTINVQNDPLQRTFNAGDEHKEKCNKEVLTNECDTDAVENINNQLKFSLEVIKQMTTPKTGGQFDLGEGHTDLTQGYSDLGDLIISTEMILPKKNYLNTPDTAENKAGTQLEDLTLDPATAGKQGVQLARDINQTPHVPAGRGLEYLSVSGCYQLTDDGLDCLVDDGGLPNLLHLDLSGCLNLSGDAVARLVDVCPNLNPAQLFYCDNILDGPYPDTASGCQNLQCNTRVCCRGAE